MFIVICCGNLLRALLDLVASVLHYKDFYLLVVGRDDEDIPVIAVVVERIELFACSAECRRTVGRSAPENVIGASRVRQYVDTRKIERFPTHKPFIRAGLVGRIYPPPRIVEVEPYFALRISQYAHRRELARYLRNLVARYAALLVV